MVNSTTIFEYDGTLSTSFTPSIINATLNRDMYEFSPLGSKSIIEEKIQGRDEPYFYDVDYEPLSFSMTIAFEDFATQEQVRDIISWLYSPKKPRLLRFQEYNMNFFGIFIGQPKFYYFGNNISGYKFIGYIEVEFRANAPYG
jgi:phage-related protein